jgi:nucleoside-diphosphate-sugar epimerase
MFRPAIHLVLNVLSAAVKTATIKRIIVTSSVAALVPVWEFAKGRLTKEVILRKSCCSSSQNNNNNRAADDELSHYDLDTEFPHPLLAYAASKAISLNAAESFLKVENLHFDVIFIMPALTIGESALWKQHKMFFRHPTDQ